MNAIPYVLLHDVSTDLGLHSGLSHKFRNVPDVPLHERTGAVKTLFWLWHGIMSKKQQGEMEERFKKIFNRQAGYKEYMDGGNWLAVLLNIEAIMLPSIDHYRVEAGWMFHFVREMVLLVCTDSRSESGHDKKQLTLAMHANAIGLWLVAKDLMERGKGHDTTEEVLEDSMSLYLHHFMADIAVLFGEEDFRVGSCQVRSIVAFFLPPHMKPRPSNP